MTDYIKRTDAVKIAEKYGLANGSVLGRHTGLADCIEKRLCMLAAKETRAVVKLMCKRVIYKCPEFKGLFAAHCAKYGDCDEMKPCETGRRLQGGNDTGD